MNQAPEAADSFWEGEPRSSSGIAPSSSRCIHASSKRNRLHQADPQQNGAIVGVEWFG
ncbi:hypothetical protein [Pseudomonas sp. Q2-TVG4-2]|uniref:hypothetical protein n=1 Tax=Pseudomonas sp. Q2-TVG4-2 TaxID=1685699 RepID=UPI0015E79BD6|nr:hypothetical protein [Pseudomonas sp. Q2-TVG4-2]